MSDLQGGVEIISYQCIACNRASPGFLLGYVLPGDDETGGTEAGQEPTGRAEIFSKATESYKLRAKMQSLLKLKNDILLQAGSTDHSPDVEQE